MNLFDREEDLSPHKNTPMILFNPTIGGLYFLTISGVPA